jgi:type II secretory pathway pseudopilin PulG
MGRVRSLRSEVGFTLVEVMIALLLTLTVMAAVFGLLQRGQEGFRREPEISDLNQSARTGVDMISRDLVMAGYKTPAHSAILWGDGGLINPDEVTVIFADPDVPTSEPLKCSANGGGPCNTINQSSTLNIDPDTLDPPQAHPEDAYSEGMILFAIETDDCNGDGEVGIYPFEVSLPPTMTNAGGSPTLKITHNPGHEVTGTNVPGGFNGQVHPDCAVIGRFRVIQYRINPLPPSPNPTLERRDLSNGEPWIPVAKNIENLQFQYALGNSNNFVDAPAIPNLDDPATWITKVRLSVVGRSDSRNLRGASQGVFDPGDTYVRKTFATTVSLRNMALAAGMQSGGEYYN